MDTELFDKLREKGINLDSDDLKIVLAAAGAFYTMRETAQDFEETVGNTYKDNDFRDEIWRAINNVCEAFHMDVSSFIK